MIRLIAFILCVTPPVYAQSTFSDAFGIMPSVNVSDTRRSWAGMQSQDSTQVAVPAGAADTVLLFVGPKSITAGMEDAHAVALGLDRFGNLVANDSAARIIVGSTILPSLATHNGIAHVLFRPAPISGTFPAGATIGNRQSQRVIFRVTSDLSQLTPTLEELGEGTPIETLAGIHSPVLQDTWGNIVEDGIAANIFIAHEDGTHTLLTTAILGGQISAQLLTRDIASEGVVTTNIGALTSPPILLSLKNIQALGPTNAQVWAVPEIDAIHLRAGPFMTDQGHLLIDGALVTITVRTHAGQLREQSGWIKDGYFNTLVALTPGGKPLEVTIQTPLGREQLLIDVSPITTTDFISGDE